METRAADIADKQRITGGVSHAVHGAEGIVFDPSRLRQADWHTFDNSRYADAQPVDGEGGRGSAWFVGSEAGPAVIKHYRRGGLMARLSRDRYLWLGSARVRSVREFALLGQMHGAGLPVPVPLAAGWRRSGLLYRAGLMTQRLAAVESFVAAVRRRGMEAPWATVGATLARFHARGMCHADLNAHNLLLGRDDAVHVIDWDKARVEPGPGQWCERVLQRLERSLRKQLPDLDAGVLAAGMERLREAHARELSA